MKAVLDYIARTDTNEKDDVPCEDELSGQFIGQEPVSDVYNRWKQDFEKYPKRGLTRKRRDAAHMILSSGCQCTDENAAKVLAAARTTMTTEFGDKGYEFMSAMHRDSGNLHVHFVVKCKNRYPGGPKLRVGPKELHHIRTQFAARLTELGLEHVSTYRKDRPDIIRRVNQGIDQLRKDERQFQRAMRRASPSRDALAYRKKVSKTIVRLREQIKKETKQGTEKRLNLLGALRKMERQITKGHLGIEKEIAASFRQYEKEFRALGKTIDQSVQLSKPGRSKQAKIEHQIQKHSDHLFRNITSAEKSIRDDKGITPQAKKEHLAALDRYRKDIQMALKNRRSSFKAPLVFGKGLKIEGHFKSLNSAVGKALALKKLKQPKTAVAKLQQRRKLERVAKEVRRELKLASGKIKGLNISPANKKKAFLELQQFGNKVMKSLGGMKKVLPQQKIRILK